jgi:hypothetical protein
MNRTIARPLSQTALAVVACGMLTCFGTAAEEQLQNEGNFTVNFTSIHLNPQKPVAISKDRDMGVYVSILTTTNAAGKGLLHNITGRCLGWFIVDRVASSYEQQGHCNFADAEGDVVYERFHFEPQKLGPVRIATGKWTGGTGKYVGLRGEFEIRVRPLNPAVDGVVQAIGTKEGRFRFTNAVAQ